MFSTQWDNCILICPFFDITCVFPAEFEKPKIGMSGKGLTLYRTITTSNDPEKKAF